MIENEKIGGLIKVLIESVRRLKLRKSVALEEYKLEQDIQNIVERDFEKAIHCCIDIGARIISLKNLPPASTYAEIFDVLLQGKIVDHKLAEDLKELARFRNVLVHQYFRIAPEKVHENLRRKLGAFSKFMKRLEEFL